VKCFTNETETVIAANLADVRLVWHEHIGGDIEDFDEYAEAAPWREMDDGESIGIRCDADGDPCGIDEGESVDKSAAEWAKRGRGYLCSTDV
jgi:hypothetical protein